MTLKADHYIDLGQAAERALRDIGREDLATSVKTLRDGYLYQMEIKNRVSTELRLALADLVAARGKLRASTERGLG